MLNNNNTLCALFSVHARRACTLYTYFSISGAMVFIRKLLRMRPMFTKASAVRSTSVAPTMVVHHGRCIVSCM